MFIKKIFRINDDGIDILKKQLPVKRFYKLLDIKEISKSKYEKLFTYIYSVYKLFVVVVVSANKYTVEVEILVVGNAVTTCIANLGITDINEGKSAIT